MVVQNTIFDQKRVVSSPTSNCSCPYVKCCDTDSDDHSNEFLSDKNQSHDSISNKNCCENFTITPILSPQKPKSILVRHESEDSVDKKSKSNRSVSFTLDDSKKPFTTSIYYGVKSYLHHFYEPVNKTNVNGGSYIDDDFEFVVEPGRQRKNDWITSILVVGIMTMLVAASILVVGPGNGPPPRGIFMDPWQLVGIVLLCTGILSILCSLLISAYQSECSCFKMRDHGQNLSSSWDPGNSWIRYTEAHSVPLYDNRIPLSEEVTAPQMNIPKK